MKKNTRLLDQINGPKDIKTLSMDELQKVAEEMRYFILEKDSQVGGHVGPNLGVVELTLAFHYVFDSPQDKMVWDVSHQSYGHKLLTGRQQGFYPGHYHEVTGYSNQHESPHDFFTVGHTSTSISLAVGLAKARDLKQEKGNVIAVIGDGSLSGGLAFEGLNNGGTLTSNLIIVVNDNEMSIDENQGSLYPHLAELRATQGESTNNLFKAMGFDYLYVEEGNDLKTMIAAFEKVKDTPHPLVMHVHTEKGHGYTPAIADKVSYHWRSPFDLTTGEGKNLDDGENYNQILSDYLIEKNQELPVIAINAAIPMMFGLKEFQAEYPDRYFDVGIAEQHSITFASALASQNIRPIVFHASTFLQRGYDQLSHDLAINENPAVIVIRGGSITNSDKTHQGTFDISYLSSIPNIKYLAPTTKEEVISMLDWALTQREQPVAIRIPEHGVIHGEVAVHDYHKATYQVLKTGEKVAILALGGFLQLGEDLHAALKKVGIQATLINPRVITELDVEQLSELKSQHQVVVTLEDGSLAGGFGEKIAGFYGKTTMKVLTYGAEKEFTDSIPVEELYQRYRLTPDLITVDILAILD